MNTKHTVMAALAVPLVCVAADAEHIHGISMPTYSATYRLEHDNQVVGTSLVSVSFDEQKNVFRHVSETRLTGVYRLLAPDSLIAQSEYTVTDGTVQPIHYEQTGGRKGSHDSSLTFDWATLQVSSSDRAFAIERGALDPASLSDALMLDLLAGQDVGPYTVIDEDGPTTYQVTIDASEAIDHPLASGGTMRLAYRTDGSSREVVTWVAPELCFLPVRIERENGGLETSMVLERIEGSSGHLPDCAG
jgi:hypothetical protein